ETPTLVIARTAIIIAAPQAASVSTGQGLAHPRSIARPSEEILRWSWHKAPHHRRRGPALRRQRQHQQALRGEPVVVPPIVCELRDRVRRRVLRRRRHRREG